MEGIKLFNPLDLVKTRRKWGYILVKLTITIEDSKEDKDKCTVKWETPTEKQLEKATETEKSTAAAIYNVISEALGKLN